MFMGRTTVAPAEHKTKCQPSLHRSAAGFLRAWKVLLIRLRFTSVCPDCDGVAGAATAGRRLGSVGGTAGEELRYSLARHDLR